MYLHGQAGRQGSGALYDSEVLKAEMSFSLAHSTSGFTLHFTCSLSADGLLWERKVFSKLRVTLIGNSIALCWRRAVKHAR